MAKKSEDEQPAFDHTVDHFPELKRVLQQLPQQEDFPDGPIERIEVTCLANGQATARVWPAHAEEPWGTFMEPSQIA